MKTGESAKQADGDIAGSSPNSFALELSQLCPLAPCLEVGFRECRGLFTRACSVSGTVFGGALLKRRSIRCAA